MPKCSECDYYAVTGRREECERGVNPVHPDLTLSCDFFDPKLPADNNVINHAPHYEAHPVQPIDVIRANGMNFVDGNVLKYIMRYSHKNGLEDLLKCLHYVLWAIADHAQELPVENIKLVVDEFFKSGGKR